MGTAVTMGITGIISNSPQTRRRRGLPVTLMMQRSGVRFIILWGMTWKSAKLFWISRRCQHHKWCKNCIEENIAEMILITRSRWTRSM
jgi:hypothetical protein